MIFEREAQPAQDFTDMFHVASSAEESVTSNSNSIQRQIMDGEVTESATRKFNGGDPNSIDSEEKNSAEPEDTGNLLSFLEGCHSVENGVDAEEDSNSPDAQPEIAGTELLFNGAQRRTECKDTNEADMKANHAKPEQFGKGSASESAKSNGSRSYIFQKETPLTRQEQARHQGSHRKDAWTSFRNFIFPGVFNGNQPSPPEPRKLPSVVDQACITKRRVRDLAPEDDQISGGMSYLAQKKALISREAGKAVSSGVLNPPRLSETQKHNREDQHFEKDEGLTKAYLKSADTCQLSEKDRSDLKRSKQKSWWKHVEKDHLTIMVSRFLRLCEVETPGLEEGAEDLVMMVTLMVRMLIRCDYFDRDLACILAHGAIIYRRAELSVMSKLSEQERGHILVVCCFIGSSFVCDEVCPLRVWQKHLFKGRCDVKTLNRACVRVLELCAWRLEGDSPEDTWSLVRFLLTGRDFERCSQSRR